MNIKIISIFIIFTLAAGVGLFAFSPSACAADNGCVTQTIPISQVSSPFEVGACANRYNPGLNSKPYQLTTRVVGCAEGAIRAAVLGMMRVVSNEYAWVFAVLSTLVIIFLGIRIATGERELLKLTITLFIKLAFINVFLQSLPELVGWVYAILAQAVAVVSDGSPWMRLDETMGQFFGFGANLVIIQGLLGVIGASILSNSVGVMLFFSGILAMMNIITFVVSLVYTYLMAMLMIGFLLIFMPIMLPLAIFFYTERYFKKWLDLIISAILVPMLLFATLSFFMPILSTLIENIFRILGGRDFSGILKMSAPVGSWQMMSDPNTSSAMQNLSTAGDLPCLQRQMTPPVQGYINPLANYNYDAGGIKWPTINLGANGVNIIQQLTFAMMTLWLFASLMKTVVQKIPGVASSIAAVSTQLTFGADSAVVKKMEEGVGKAQASLSGNMQSDATKFDKINSFAKQIGNLVGRR